MSTSKDGKPRSFRSKQSYASEQITRELLKPFFEDIGFTSVSDRRKGNSQFISGTTAGGEYISARVRLCWRWDDGARKISAAQLRARLIDNNWEKTLLELVNREPSKGVTHSLIVQRDGDALAYAALIPLNALAGIINRQREISDQLIRSGSLGRLRKNHSTNGNSPTIWLKDDRFPDSHKVADALWDFPGVMNLVDLMPASNLQLPEDDSCSDLSGVDLTLIGSDEAKRYLATASKVKRDARVRQAVLTLSGQRCEMPGCEERQFFPGYLDVHHILGAEVSDRIYNCVALCPNDHRRCHFSKEKDELNSVLLQIALSRK